MLRVALLLILVISIAHGLWRMIDGVIEGMTGQRRDGRVPTRGEQMVRDPVCGTFILPERSVSLTEGRRQLFFCSTTCRDQYRAKSA